jgi:hypothetical protein
VPEQPLIIGVRHHSPACARLVKERIEKLRPRYVLIEGPVDFNHRLDELFLPHQLPIAIYSYCQPQESSAAGHGVWTPFAEFSPEWQALLAARKTGAQIRFIDLPGWMQPDDSAPSPAVRSNHGYSHLLQNSGMENIDALWDHLFEDEAQQANLQPALETYFSGLPPAATRGMSITSGGKPLWRAGWRGQCGKTTARWWWSAAAGMPRRWPRSGAAVKRRSRPFPLRPPPVPSPAAI